MAATKPDPIIVSFWRYIKHLFFGSMLAVSTSLDETAGTISTVEAVLPSTPHKALIPAKLIETLEYLYTHSEATYEKLGRYQADVNYFVEILDNYTGAELGQFMSEINELDALINLSIGNQAQAQADLSAALALNPEGKWLVSKTAINWSNNPVENENPKAINLDSPKQSYGSVDFHNTWTQEIGGWGYSENSKFNMLRQKVFERDYFKCTWCGSRVNLTVDHIKERHLGGTNDLNNLRTLCKECHEKRHGHKIFDKDFNVDDDYGFSKHGNSKLLSLIHAADSGKGICIEYNDAQSLKSVRVIQPIRIYKAKYIYVNAFCELDNEERVFRLSRMKMSEEKGNYYLNKTNTYKGPEWTGNLFDTNVGKTIYSRPTGR